MSLLEQINNDLKDAMRAKDADKLTTLRMLTSAVKNKKIELIKDELTDEEVQQVVQREVKQRQDAVAEYEKGGRQELADKEKEEVEILKHYLPTMMSEDEIRVIVVRSIEEVEAAGPQDLGKVMKILMPQVKLKADGSVVNKIVQEELQARSKME